MSGNQMSSTSARTRYQQTRRDTRATEFAAGQVALGAGSDVDGFQAAIDLMVATDTPMAHTLYVKLTGMGYDVPASIRPACVADEDQEEDDEADWREHQAQRRQAQNGRL
jgi:hypothetical protein